MKPNDKAIEAALAAHQEAGKQAELSGHLTSQLWMREILTAAFAAQFQSEDYAGLIARARKIDQCDDHDLYVNAIIITDLAYALEALLAERDALLARLAPVKDEALVEIASREIFIERRSLAAAIAAIRPHIEAAERERCAKIADKYEGEWHSDTAEDACARAIAAAIRSGK